MAHLCPISTALRVSFIGLICIASISSVQAQQTVVDPNSKNFSGGLSDALVFGGPEAGLPIRVCAGVNFTPPCTIQKTTIPTEEGIGSTRGSDVTIAGEPPRVYPNQYGLDFYTSALPRLSITHDGHVGIGTQKPDATLELTNQGNVDIAITSMSTDGTGTRWILRSSNQGGFQIINGSTNSPFVTVDSNGQVSMKTLRILGGSDLSEPFSTDRNLPLGSVVSIDPKHSGNLKLSDRAYDRHVAGIISGAGGVGAGLTLEQLNAGEAQQVALSGRAYALANTSGGKIEPGDLLTTSTRAGEAMKAAMKHRSTQGTIIGKAMSSLESGSGLVLVLVNLQ